MAEVVTDEVNENVTGQGVEFKVGKAKHPNGLLVDTISELAASASVSFPNALKSNVINEYTATGGGAGVTVDGVLIKDNGLTASGSASLGSLSLTTKLAVADGGTGASSLTDGGVLLGGGDRSDHGFGLAGRRGDHHRRGRWISNHARGL